MDEQQPGSQGNQSAPQQAPAAPQQSSGQQQASTQHQNRMLMGILAYIGILIIIPYLVDKEDPFVKFHIKQGLVLFIAEVVVWLLLYSGFLYMLWPLIQLINLCVLILAIIGIVNVVQGKQTELPLVGSLAHKFNF